MNKLISLVLLTLASAPAFAAPALLPEPEIFSLLGIGALAAYMASKRKGSK